jgi:uncharacterized protein
MVQFSSGWTGETIEHYREGAHPMTGQNKTIRFANRLAVGMITAVVLLLVGRAGAQGSYPEPQDLYVNDYAGVMTTETEANVRALFMDLRQQRGIEASVLTVNSIRDYGTNDPSIEAFATNLFNTWGIGDATLNNGVLILVAVADREVRIEVGAGYGDTLDDQMAYVINEFMLNSFKRGDYSGGIYQGARAVVQSLTGVWPEDLDPPPVSVPGFTYTRTTPSPDKGHSLLTYLLAGGGGAGVVGTGAYGVQRYLRLRKRRCPNCKTWMVRLDEVSDDMYLTSGQKLEEVIASIDYDVWQCPNCNYHTLLSYQRWMSGYRHCSSCGYRTLRVSSRTVVSPTYTSTGTREITERCENCDHNVTHTVIIPRLTRSSTNSSGGGSHRSGGSSSFGGGHSSGGGASGKW